MEGSSLTGNRHARGTSRPLLRAVGAGSVGWLLTQILVTGGWVGLRTWHWSEPSSTGPKAPESRRSKSLQPEALSSAVVEPGGAGARLRGLDARPCGTPPATSPPGAPSPTSRRRQEQQLLYRVAPNTKWDFYRAQHSTWHTGNVYWTISILLPQNPSNIWEKGSPPSLTLIYLQRLDHPLKQTMVLFGPSFPQRAFIEYLFSDHHCAGHWLKKVTEASLSSWEQEEVKTNYKVN